MASLKEVKNRINSVHTTRKITQARQMVASAQLHRAQAELAGVRSCLEALQTAVEQVASHFPEESPYFKADPAGRTAVVAFSSDSGMCGAFNARIIREMMQAVPERPLVFPVGRKMRDALKNAGVPVENDFDALDHHSTLEAVCAMAAGLLKRFLEGSLSRVDILYYEFKSVASQQIVRKTLLPLPAADIKEYDYIVEPSAEELAAVLLPMLVRTQFSAAVASNRASEHAARMLAMQLATENANELLDELQLMYNKLRQQNITSELLDIIGSSFA